MSLVMCRLVDVPHTRTEGCEFPVPWSADNNPPVEQASDDGTIVTVGPNVMYKNRPLTIMLDRAGNGGAVLDITRPELSAILRAIMRYGLSS